MYRFENPPDQQTLLLETMNSNCDKLGAQKTLSWFMWKCDIVTIQLFLSQNFILCISVQCVIVHLHRFTINGLFAFLQLVLPFDWDLQSASKVRKGLWIHWQCFLLPLTLMCSYLMCSTLQEKSVLDFTYNSIYAQLHWPEQITYALLVCRKFVQLKKKKILPIGWFLKRCLALKLAQYNNKKARFLQIIKPMSWILFI